MVLHPVTGYPLVSNSGAQPQADWPVIEGFGGNVFGGIALEGAGGDPSSINVYGLTLDDLYLLAAGRFGPHR